MKIENRTAVCDGRGGSGGIRRRFFLWNTMYNSNTVFYDKKYLYIIEGDRSVSLK